MFCCIEFWVGIKGEIPKVFDELCGFVNQLDHVCTQAVERI